VSVIICWSRYADFVRQAGPAGACAGVTVSTWKGQANMSLPLGDAVTQLNVAPVLHGGGGAALLGEAGKVTAVSAYRFSSIGEPAVSILESVHID
jgi:hypothetical protein